MTFVGLRPGEKLYEELYFDDERSLETSHPKLRAAYHRPFCLSEVRREQAQLKQLLTSSDETILRRLQQLVPEFAAAMSPTNGRKRSPASARMPIQEANCAAGTGRGDARRNYRKAK
jgi:FlaA1/EpsC-like NDP-sugar epimerase